MLHSCAWEKCGSKALFWPFFKKEKSLKPLKFQAFWHPQPESNQQLIFRRDLLYPFNYEGILTMGDFARRLAYLNTPPN